MRSSVPSRLAAVFGALAALMLAAAPASAAQPNAASDRVDVIVVFVDGIQDSRAAAPDVARDHDAEIRHIYDHAIDGFSASVPSNRLRGLENDRRVAYVNENRPVQAFEEEVPTGVSRIDAPGAHSKATGDGVRVAVIDTGIDSDHEDLKANLDVSTDWDCINNDDNAEDDQGHGTHVAGTIAAVGGNGLGVIGVAPKAELVGIKVLDHRGSGSWESVICGIDHVHALNNDKLSDGTFDTSNDIDVANMSLGGSGGLDENETCGNTTDALYESICNATDPNQNGATFTVAAGNDSKDASEFVPAAYPEVITVSAYQDTDGTTADAGCTGFPWTVCDEEFAYFSNYGEIVDVIAPGRDILSTTYDGKYDTKSGTSMAAPHVAGVAALVLQGQPSLTPAQVETYLQDTGQCPDTKQNAENDSNTDDCVNQGTWTDDLDAITEPMVNAAFATASTSTSNDSAPAADFTSSCTDLTCDFTDASTDDGTIQSWAWDFDGDSNTDSTSQNPSHTYASDGTYTVTLTVTDDAGQTDSVSKDITVSKPSDFSLTASGYKVKGRHHIDLTWSGATSTDVDVYLKGAFLEKTPNDGEYTHSTNNVGGGSYTFQVCEAGTTTTCSNEATVTF